VVSGAVCDKDPNFRNERLVVSITVRLNGKEHLLASPVTVAQLIERLGLDRKKVAIERNLEIVPRSIHETTLVNDGDRLEIVSFVGGG